MYVAFGGCNASAKLYGHAWQRDKPRSVLDTDSMKAVADVALLHRG